MIAELLEQALRAEPRRDDWMHPHMSAISCDLQSWAERGGEPMAERSFESLLKMRVGLWFEDAALNIVEPLALKLGYMTHRNVVLIFDPFSRKLRFGTHGLPLDLSPTELVGHPDFLLTALGQPPLVVELKTTAYLGKALSEHWIEQTMNYATALGAEKGIVVATDFKKIVEQEFLTADYEAWCLMRMKEIVTRTNPEAMPPAPEPRQSWSCNYCGWHGCELNPNAPKVLA